METPMSPASITQPRLSQCSSASLSPEMERDFLKEKIEHFKVFIKKLQDELQSQKIRKEGAETVSKLLQESKHQTQALQKRVKSLETVIWNLQSRLEQNGLSSEVTLHEGEDYFPGHSKNLLDNLTRENARLRHLLRQQNGDPEELAKVQKELDDAVKGNTDLQSRVAALEQVLKASDNDKDQQITLLREQMTGMELELRTRRIECTELDEEKRKLECQLRMVAQQCHELAQKLHSEAADATGKPNSQEGTQKATDSTDQIQFLKDENAKLTKSIQEITKMNRNWQQYNNQREEYVRQMQTELAELKGNGRNHSDNARELEVQMNKVLDEARRSVNKVNHEKEQMKRHLDESRGQVKALTSQVDQLKRHIGTGGAGDTAEVIQALKAQVEICTEDFESERRDREKAQSKLNRMEVEMEHLRRENEHLKSERQQLFISGQQILSPSNAHQPSNMFSPYHAANTDYYGHDQYNELAARGARNVIDGGKSRGVKEVVTPPESDGLSTVCSDDVKDVVMSNKEEDKDEYVSLRTSSISSCAKESVSSNASSHDSRPRSPSRDAQTLDAQPEMTHDSAKTSSDLLQCPSCHKEYPTTQQLELMEHMEECCD